MSWNIASDETDVFTHIRNQRGPHLHVQGRLPRGSNVGVEPINPHKS